MLRLAAASPDQSPSAATSRTGRALTGVYARAYRTALALGLQLRHTRCSRERAPIATARPWRRISPSSPTRSLATAPKHWQGTGSRACAGPWTYSAFMVHARSAPELRCSRERRPELLAQAETFPLQRARGGERVKLLTRELAHARPLRSRTSSTRNARAANSDVFDAARELRAPVRRTRNRQAHRVAHESLSDLLEVALLQKGRPAAGTSCAVRADGGAAVETIADSTSAVIIASCWRTPACAHLLYPRATAGRCRR